MKKKKKESNTLDGWCNLSRFLAFFSTVYIEITTNKKMLKPWPDLDKFEGKASVEAIYLCCLFLFYISNSIQRGKWSEIR